jgi:hypothetical protein
MRILNARSRTEFDKVEIEFFLKISSSNSVRGLFEGHGSEILGVL